jgi:putative peptidoglycan binding protein
MPLQSSILSGNPFLERVAQGASLLRAGSPSNDPVAVKLVQQALAALGFPLPISFRSGAPDGRFGQETASAVTAFQKTVFPGQPREWDGRVGRKTLGLLDAKVLRLKPGPGPMPPAPAVNFVCGPDVSVHSPHYPRLDKVEHKGMGRLIRERMNKLAKKFGLVFIGGVHSHSDLARAEQAFDQLASTNIQRLIAGQAPGARGSAW